MYKTVVELNAVDLIIVDTIPVEPIPCRAYYECVLELIISGRPKEKFLLSAESRKRGFKKSSFLQKYRKYRKAVFLQKEAVSAERGSFCKEC